MGKGITRAPTENRKMIMSRDAEMKRYRATVETPCENHEPHAVEITGDGEQVWGAAMATRAVIERNGGAVAIHFYVDGKEVDWRETMDDINLGFMLADILANSGPKVNLEDLLF